MFDDPRSATARPPNPKRPTSAPRRSGTTASVRPACRQELAACLLRLRWVLSTCLTAGLIWQVARGSIVPWVVQVDKLGEAQAVAPADAGYRPTDPQVAFHLARFIEQVRSIPADPIIVRQNWLRAYDFATDKRRARAQRLCPDQRSVRPDRREQVGVDVQRHPRLTDQLPRRLGRASLPRRQPCRNEPLDRDPDHRRPDPAHPDALRKNPLGIFVNAINWSKELGS
jgi:type IV secretory pathway TrbF-like protein